MTEPSAAATPEPESPLGELTGDPVPRMVKATLAMAASSAAVIAFAAVRAKIVAVELGPQGIGALTLLLSFVTFAALALGLGIGNSAVKEIAAAEARGESAWRDQLRRALYVLSAVLALTGAVVIALLAGPIADLLGDPGLETEMRLAALAVGATVIGAAALADLNGFRHIRALARIEPLAGLTATIAAALAWLAGADLILVVILAPTLALAVFALFATRTLPPLGGFRRPTSLTRPSRHLVTLGVAFVTNSVLAALGALLLRILIDGELGRAATGEFQAAFAIAGYYVSFIFTALATDYLPLLSSLSDDEPRLNEVANSQLLVAVLMSAPIVMLLIVAAPVIVPLFYSGSFTDTPGLLQVMLLGELTRIAAWTIGYILVARTARTLFVATELLYNLLLIGLTAAFIPRLGLEGTALAFLICQLASLGWTLAFVRRVSRFSLSHRNVLNLAGYGGAAGLAYAAAATGGVALGAAWVIVVATAVVATRALLRLLPEAPAPLSRLFSWTGRAGS